MLYRIIGGVCPATHPERLRVFQGGDETGMQWKQAIRSGAMIACCVVMVFAAPCLGMTFNVTNTADSGAGSLRDAITQANTNNNDSEVDIITFFSTLFGQPDHVDVVPVNGFESVVDSGFGRGPSVDYARRECGVGVSYL